MKYIDVLAPNLSGKGGTETVLSLVLGNGYLSNNFRFNLLLLDKPGDMEWLKKISCKNSYSVRNTNKRLLWILRHLIITKSDAVIVLGPRLALISKVIKIIFRKKYKIVTWIHFSLLHQDIMDTKYVRFADYHLAISKQMVEQFQMLGVDKQKVYVVYNPVSLTNRSSNYLISEDNEIHISYIGRIMLDGQKNLRLLLDSIHELSKIVSKNIFIDFWGDGNILEVQNYAEEINLADYANVSWHGWVENPWDRINIIDMLILTSKFEGFGMVLTEAISRNVPVVATDYPVGARDIVVPGINGEIVGYSPEKVARAILKVSEYSNKKCIKGTINKFAIDKFQQRFSRSLNDILEG